MDRRAAVWPGGGAGEPARALAKRCGLAWLPATSAGEPSAQAHAQAVARMARSLIPREMRDGEIA